MQAVIEKMLIEDDFMINVLLNGEEVLLRFNDLEIEEIQKIFVLKENIINFFGGYDAFFEKIGEVDFRAQVLEYSKEKYTYLLATERAGIVQTIVWVS